MAHYQFKQRLKASVALRSGKRVFDVEEGFTSKTTFTCGSCGYEADRDVNGARNIMLRAVYHGPASMCPRLGA